MTSLKIPVENVLALRLITEVWSCPVSGLNPTDLRGSRTGVYIGVSGSEAGEAFSRDPEELLGYSMTGCQRAMFANRLSYFFDFNGEWGGVTPPSVPLMIYKRYAKY